MAPEVEESTQQVTNEPLRLLLSPREQSYILKRLHKARRQLFWGILIPALYFGLFYYWDATGTAPPDGFLLIVGLAFFPLFGVTFHLLLSGGIDWIMFTRYRNNHQAFLDRYNRSMN